MEVKKDERLFPRTIKEVKELETYYKKDITQLIDDLDRWVNHNNSCIQNVMLLEMD